jgi:HNH endonuclease
LSWRIAHGAITSEQQVLHHCDDRRCVRPDHLFLGDNDANVADKMAKGRHQAQPRGEANTRALLTDDQIRQIRALYGTGPSQEELGRRFGVCQGQISRVVRRVHWSHI